MNKRRAMISRRGEVGALLEAFFQSRDYIPAGAHCIRAEEELPLALKTQAQEAGVAWRAWDDGSHTWFAKAKPVSWKSAAGLQVMFFDVDGRLASSGVWLWLKSHGWILSEAAAVM